MPRQSGSQRNGLRRALPLVFVAILACLAAGLEASLRAKRGPPPPDVENHLRTWFLDVYGPYFHRVTGPEGQDEYVSDPKYDLGARFPARKPPGARRIFLVGESAAKEFLKDVKVPLTDMLARLYPGKGFELIGCGINGFDSRRAGFVQREVLSYDPDLVLVMSGNNEYHQPIPKRLTGFKLQILLSRSWLARLLQEALPSRPPPFYPYDRRMSDYAENLAGMARSAKARGVPTALCTLPMNLADYPPGNKSPELISDAVFVEGQVRFERGDYAAAARGFRKYLEAHPESALGAWRLGRAEMALSRYDSARAALTRAIELDSRPGERSPPSRAAIVREAARREGAVLVDLARDFAQRSPHGLTGQDLMMNNAHWYHELNAFAASRIARALLDAGLWKEDLAPAPERAKAWAWIDGEARKAEGKGPTVTAAMWRQGLCRIHDLGGEEWSEAVVSMFDTVARHDPAGLRALASFPRFVSEIRTLQCLPPQTTDGWLEERWPGLLAHVGEAFRRRGDLKPAREFLELAREKGAPSTALDRSLMLAYAAAGRGEKAREAYQRLKGRPGSAEEARIYAGVLGLPE